MAKAELKTRPTGASVEAFLDGLEHEQQRTDSFCLVKIFKRVTGEEAAMWGPAIIGFGSQMLKYASGRELDWPELAFSPRKGNLTLYITDGRALHEGLIAKLGKHKLKGVCLHIKRLSDVDESVLEELIGDSLSQQRNK